ncbi:hypothetical protein [Campylobacter insulaenigrae]|nr:hypothetical protein [Campylobacter insulaenigrae]MCR6571523.1 hypothetical protein [Campylobacter insulaenigrae]MCR6583856.1 hypothetical protein [Campylobacter insulaenigrae]
MNNKFNFAKFVLDCFICFGIVIISPFVYSILIKSDDFRWLLYPIQWLLYPIQWLLYPIQWLFNIDTHTINDISILIIGFCSLSIISFFIIGFFYKIHKLSLFLSLIFMICYAIFGYYFFSHL